ncbi:acetate--CoA ligase family protein [Mycobacterium sp. KBS0706]|uniref:acetate--CoA ligase family protein n=1 Tax=Mycobacterium sp. KBS0706 TaxID=2578109 RepID=UPI00110F89A5|nr:acetate--CoA ligase family protein [Mycobacterium sp. KBS0706]TSD83606.1 acetate--CoA ligase family protein [Mycobacterium sp. KBS0706]
MGHPLDPLLRPRSIAVVGASARPGSVGAVMLRQLVEGGFPGPVHPVNPKGGMLAGLPCLTSIADLPEPVEHAAFCLGDETIAEAFAAALRQGVKAATIVAPLADAALRERIRAMALEAGVALCGGNGMGFYNFTDRVRLCGFATRPDHVPGGAVLLTHSGSLFTALVDAEARIDYALAVSSGQELTTTLADYLDFALDQPETWVVGLFLEAARDPERFVAALAKAQARNIPVVALKVGRTRESAALALSHSGAIAGDHAAYDALFERHAVGHVRSVDELAAAMMLLPVAASLGPGGLASTHDSGGERGLMVDLAAAAGVRFASLSPATEDKLEAALDPGLPPVNPLDHWGTGRNYPTDFEACFQALMADPDTALGALALDRSVGGQVTPLYLEVAHQARAASGKPVVIVSNHQGSGSDPAAVASTRAGVPVLDGVPAFLRACRIAFDRRDAAARPPMHPPRASEAAVQRWRARLADGHPLTEAEALRLLADFGLAVTPCAMARDESEAVEAAMRIGFPVALKTAGAAHKTDVDGVRLGLADPVALRQAHRDLAVRLGPQVMVARMVRDKGVEMMLGLQRDPDFGPVVLVGFGGIHAEILKDVAFALPPFDAAEARRLVDRLRLRPLLDGVRGAPAADIEALAEAAARFSALAAALGDRVEAIDVNPVLVLPHGAVAVDARVVEAI